MKLFDKKTISNTLASQRKTQIEEGLSLAKKIDALRETLASLEAQQSAFIAGMKSELDRETKELSHERSILKQEVATLKEQRTQLQIPLDSKWNELHEREEAIFSHEEKLRNDRDVFARIVSDNTELSRQIEIEKGRAAEFSHSASENLVRSEEILEKAEERSNILRKKAKAIVELAEVRDEESVVREKRSLQEEQRLILREEILQKRETKVSDDERRLKDRYDTLLKTTKRING